MEKQEKNAKLSPDKKNSLTQPSIYPSDKTTGSGINRTKRRGPTSQALPYLMEPPVKAVSTPIKSLST